LNFKDFALEHYLIVCIQEDLVGEHRSDVFRSNFQENYVWLPLIPLVGRGRAERRDVSSIDRKALSGLWREAARLIVEAGCGRRTLRV